MGWCNGWRSGGLDIALATRNGRYIAVDAAEMLSGFMVDGLPDEQRFNALLAGLLAEVSAGRRTHKLPPAIFGEMVALLWAEGKIEAAVRLEQLWNNLAQTHSFDLRCAYPIGGFGQVSHGTPFQLICAEHSHVIPAESYTSLENEEERLRLVSVLQQKAQTLQAIADERECLYNEAQEEIARRTKAEEALRESEEFSRGVLENSVDCLQVMDLNGTVLYTSPAGQRALQIDGDGSHLNSRWMDGWVGGRAKVGILHSRSRWAEELAISRGIAQRLQVRPNGGM